MGKTKNPSNFRRLKMGLYLMLHLGQSRLSSGRVSFPVMCLTERCGDLDVILLSPVCPAL